LDVSLLLLLNRFLSGPGGNEENHHFDRRALPFKVFWWEKLRKNY
jgi:hypothetical protein